MTASPASSLEAMNSQAVKSVNLSSNAPFGLRTLCGRQFVGRPGRKLVVLAPLRLARTNSCLLVPAAIPPTGFPGGRAPFMEHYSYHMRGIGQASRIFSQYSAFFRSFLGLFAEMAPEVSSNRDVKAASLLTTPAGSTRPAVPHGQCRPPLCPNLTYPPALGSYRGSGEPLNVLDTARCRSRLQLGSDTASFPTRPVCIRGHPMIALQQRRAHVPSDAPHCTVRHTVSARMHRTTAWSPSGLPRALLHCSL